MRLLEVFSLPSGHVFFFFFLLLLEPKAQFVLDESNITRV